MRPADLARLQRIVAALRAPDGCPWDRQQDLETLRHYLLEETYEVLEVMNGDDPEAHAEELGDLLFQVVLQSQVRAERGAFGLAEVVDGIADKLERRHPHVFSDEEIDDPEQVTKRWQALKRAEGKGGIEDVPRALPALMRAEKIGRKAAGAGFDWPDIQGPLDKVAEELAELRAVLADDTLDRQRAGAELGDLLFAVVNVARHLDVRPELALDGATDRFLGRYLYVARALRDQGRTLESADLEVLDALWEQAKVALG